MFTTIKKKISFYKRNKEILKNFKINLKQLINNEDDIASIIYSSVPVTHADGSVTAYGRHITTEDIFNHFKSQYDKSTLETKHKDKLVNFLASYTASLFTFESSIFDAIMYEINDDLSLSDKEKEKYKEKVEQKINKIMNDNFLEAFDNIFDEVIDINQ